MSELIKREQVPKELTWNLEDIFKTINDFEDEFSAIQNDLSKAERFAGHLHESAQILLDALKFNLELLRRISKLYVYAHMKNDQDTSDNQNAALESRAGNLYAQVGAKIAYFEPELISIDNERISELENQLPELMEYKFYIEELLRGREHILSGEVEELLAGASDIFGYSEKIFSIFSNADLKFGKVKNEKGELVDLSNGIYSLMLESDNRKVRQDAFDAMYDKHIEFKNTFAGTLSQNTHMQNFMAKTRKYQSARQSALFKNNLEDSVFTNLIDSVNEHLPLLHKFVGLRKKILKLDTVNPYDLYVPIGGAIDMKFDYQQAKEIVLDAMEPLGADYVAILKAAFDQRWIDVVENQGKRTGAYSSGSYDTNPYILLNWQDNLDNVFTLAHELGHSVHSYLTHANQPFQYGNYPIFLAEIASTTNEQLLTEYLLEKYKDPKIQIYILNHFLDGFKGTIYRQTQFAEFEDWLHQQDANGAALTQDQMTEYYYQLNKKYYGPDLSDEEKIGYEWSRIPHFYYNYYVYQYATGKSAALSLSKQILNDPSSVDKYLNYLKAGSSDYPAEIMKRAGVDMTSKKYLEDAFEIFEQKLEQFENLINSHN